jgi:hypothetical protein
LDNVDNVRSEAHQMLTLLIEQGQRSQPDQDIVERARTRLIVALMELSDDHSYRDVHSESSVVLDQLAEMLEDPELALSW